MTGLSPEAVRFFKFLLILVLYSLAMTILNFLLAVNFRNGGIAILISSLFNLFAMTFAGFCKSTLEPLNVFGGLLSNVYPPLSCPFRRYTCGSTMVAVAVPSEILSRGPEC